eukprot:1512173-Rhodomonas_salina.3
MQHLILSSRMSRPGRQPPCSHSLTASSERRGHQVTAAMPLLYCVGCCAIVMPSSVLLSQRAWLRCRLDTDVREWGYQGKDGVGSETSMKSRRQKRGVGALGNKIQVMPRLLCFRVLQFEVDVKSTEIEHRASQPIRRQGCMIGPMFNLN